ncbi:MAG: helix-turn-helix domain-containing protein [Bacteroidales bacterium]|nr:helix-turn-helix domain-containing protein [Bacteroidales bacterium]MBQ7709571.1 helix-turn-helix domain-containing protein [Bacteroidales bacterium]
MPSSIRYPDTLRQQAVALSRKGKGYKAIARELGLPRDTVRNWIVSYRTTGRTESVQTTGQLRTAPSFRAREDRFTKAREEYETTSASLLSIAQKHSLNYNNLRNYLLSNHPESALLHAYAKRSAELQEQLVEQIATIQKTGEQLLQQMRQELDAQLARLQ